MKLVCDDLTYEVTYEDKEEEDQTKWPVFVMRKLSAARVNIIGDRVTKMEKGNKLNYLGGTASKMQIDAALVDWRNVQDETGAEAKCNAANKEKLPASVQGFLLDEIKNTNKLEGPEESERKN